MPKVGKDGRRLIVHELRSRVGFDVRRLLTVETDAPSTFVAPELVTEIGITVTEDGFDVVQSL